MKLPEVDRVIYSKNPLDKVVCQIRFSPILRIKESEPVEFQEAIKQDYQDYEEIVTPEYILKEKGNNLEIVNHITHQFTSDDKKWQVSLNPSFVALTSNDYKKWEDFIFRFEKLIKVSIDIYKITSCIRVGLRYVDVIKKEEKDSWSEYLKKPLLGLLNTEPIIEESEISMKQSNIRIKPKDEEFKINVNHGLVENNTYVFDCDYYYEGKDNISGYRSRLDSYREYTKRFFRWAITDEYHKKLGPEPFQS